jgi:enoyl-CoA hydratase/carnithine racemase
VAARDAVLSLPEVQRGIVAAGGALLRLPSTNPRSLATEMALTGDPLSVERAASAGLVSRVTEPGEALAVATRLAKKIATNAPLATVAPKTILGLSDDGASETAWAAQRRIVDRVFESDDAREGGLAFLERRPPHWRGR